jgi:bud site selection protein 20
MPAIRGSKSKKKTRRYTRDLDQIHADLSSEAHLVQYKKTKAVEDLPGLGQWYCKECAKWFEGEANFTSHRRGKNHKRRYKNSMQMSGSRSKLTDVSRLRQLREEPHTQKESEAAIGLSTDNGKHTNTVMEIDDGPVTSA